MNMLIAHLDLVAIPSYQKVAVAGYEDDRAAGLINGGLGGNSEKQDTRSSSKGGGQKSASSSKSSNRSGGGNTSYGSSSTPRRPGSSKGGRQGRPSTATGGRGSSNLNANRYSSLKNSGADAFTNGVIGYNAKSIGPNHMGQAGGISMSMAGKAVTTPEAFRVNPQRRSMWKLDLQREEDVVRMQPSCKNLRKCAHRLKLMSMHGEEACSQGISVLYVSAHLEYIPLSPKEVNWSKSPRCLVHPTKSTFIIFSF